MEPERPAPSKVLAAGAGVVSAGLALGASELVVGARGTGPSLVSAVGTEFIDRYAASLKDLAVSLFGTNDKPALVIGIVLTSLVLGAVLGVQAARRRWVGVAGFVAFGLLGLWAYERAPLRNGVTGVLAATAAVLVGIGSLLGLLALLDGAAAAAPSPSPRTLDGVAGPGGVQPAPRAMPGSPGGAPRRTFLVSAAVAGVGAAALGAWGRRLHASGAIEQARQAVQLPPATPIDPIPASQPFTIAELTPYVTPNADFYRIDTALIVPSVPLDGWQLDVKGMVDRPFSLTYDELLALPTIEETITLQCVSNEVGGDLVGNATWQGVPLTALLERAGVQLGGTQLVGRSIDRFTAGFPIEKAVDGRVAMVAYAMNGEPLPAVHGFPARLVVAGLYGYVSATKWLTELEVATWDGFDGYWITRGWSKEGPIKPMSRIDVPRTGDHVEAGTTIPIAGVAWAPTGGVSGVEVRVDEGAWLPATLGDAASGNTWVQWMLPWQATSGDHTISVRALDSTGQPQTSDVAPPAPDGATGWHSRWVRVTG